MTIYRSPPCKHPSFTPWISSKKAKAVHHLHVLLVDPTACSVKYFIIGEAADVYARTGKEISFCYVGKLSPDKALPFSQLKMWLEDNIKVTDWQMHKLLAFSSLNRKASSWGIVPRPSEKAQEVPIVTVLFEKKNHVILCCCRNQSPRRKTKSRSRLVIMVKKCYVLFESFRSKSHNYHFFSRRTSGIQST